MQSKINSIKDKCSFALNLDDQPVLDIEAGWGLPVGFLEHMEKSMD